MDKSGSDSMTTVQMKADYAASEIYSTTSEAPPAYPMREASSVKIAKIIAATVLLASLIIGSFVLGATYLQARASCDQMQALDSMLEKELMLETLQQELPKAEALLSAANGNSADDDDAADSNSLSAKKSASSAAAADQLGDYNDADESADLNRPNGVNVKLPLELNLSELAHAIMQSQQKSRMNCVIERRQAEEILDNDVQQLMFGGEPRKRITGERMAIFCESGSEARPQPQQPQEPQAEQLPPIMMRPVPYGAMPVHFPHTHMPMQMEPRQQHPQLLVPPPMPQQQPQQQSTVMRMFPGQFIVRQIHLQPQPEAQQQQQQERSPLPSFLQALAGREERREQPHQPRLVALRFNIPPPPQQPEQVLTAPRPMMPLMPMPMPMNNHHADDSEERQLPYQIRNELLELQKQQQQQQQHREMMMMPPPQQQQPQPQPQGVQLQRVPLSLALQRVGITPDDLRNIQHMAEARIKEEVDQMNQEFKNMQQAAAGAAQQKQTADDATSTASAASASSSSSSAAVASSSAASSASDSSSSNDDDSSAEMNVRSNVGASESTDADDDDSEEDSQILQIGRTQFGRSVVTPIRIPVNLMQAITEAENMEAVVKEDAEHRMRTVDQSRHNIGEDSERR